MIAGHVYMDTVYTSEVDLFRCERVTAEYAEPCAFPDDLPAAVYCVDDGPILFDGVEALSAFKAGARRLQ